MLGLISICFFSISVVCMGFLSAKLAFYFMLGLYLLLGIASINITISFQSELQKEIKPEMLGRISSLVLALIMSSIPIGQFIYGLIFKWMNPAIPFVITAVIIFIITVYYGVTYKKEWRLMGLIYQESGNKEGETIIFIHACGVSSWMWYGQKCFMEEYRCIFLICRSMD